MKKRAPLCALSAWPFALPWPGRRRRLRAASACSQWDHPCGRCAQPCGGAHYLCVLLAHRERLVSERDGGVGQWSGRGQGRRPDPPHQARRPSISRPTAATCTCRTESSARATASWFPSEPCARRWAPGVEWDGTQSTIQITSGSGPILSGEQAYQADVVYWLSRIIYAESGNQPLDGKIAVGNVVLNRVASPRFPNSVYEVIFQRNQFTPAANGSINRTPSAESVVAAKLCLDGANTAGSACTL